VECYAGQLNQVFMNILVNAIEALEERDKTLTLEEIKKKPSAIYSNPIKHAIAIGFNP